MKSQLEIRKRNEYKSLSKTYLIQLSENMSDIANRKEKLAFSEYQNLIGLLKNQSILFLELGKTFKKIRDEKLFKYIGDGGFETWERFLSQPEIHVKPSTARFYISIYEEYIQRLKMSIEDVARLGFARLQKLLPVVRNVSEEKAIEIIDDIGILGSNDFNLEVNKLKGYDDEDNSTYFPTVQRCNICGKWEIIAKKEDICQRH